MNLAICVSGVGAMTDFSTLLVNAIPSYDMVTKGQCFPLYAYCTGERGSDMTDYANNLFGNAGVSSSDGDGLQRKENITDAALAAFRARYKDDAIGKEDIFFYVYGVLHSPDYRRRFADNLRRQLPRIPFAPDFWAFSKAGETLAELHVEYEHVEPWPLDELVSTVDPDPKKQYRVEQMRWGGTAREKDKTVLHYNGRITLTGIPPEAHEYVVNGKPALDWIVERYAVATGKQSGLVNDPNDWSDDPRYILDLVKRVTRVAVETVRVVKALPALE